MTAATTRWRGIVGETMKYHPHGDASIKDALVQLGQKDLLIDCQGNWGNILTGDDAAAGRYIEARLSKFALDVVFNRKTTEWMRSYDGRNEEPVTLPIKFPLLLAQGSDGIAVGLASKILPHNFIELINAAIAHLEGRDFDLYPDFPTGGMADVSRYNDGLRGGTVKVRAKISKIDKRTLAITEIPYTTTTESIKESIIKANDKGKIKIRKVDDNTADKVEIVIQVAPDESSDKTIDALYAFTDCEVSIAPNACVIWDEKPHFLGVKEILRRSASTPSGCWAASWRSASGSCRRRGMPPRSSGSSSRTASTSSSRGARPARRPTLPSIRDWNLSRNSCDVK